MDSLWILSGLCRRFLDAASVEQTDRRCSGPLLAGSRRLKGDRFRRSETSDRYDNSAPLRMGIRQISKKNMVRETARGPRISPDAPKKTRPPTIEIKDGTV